MNLVVAGLYDNLLKYGENISHNLKPLSKKAIEFNRNQITVLKLEEKVRINMREYNKDHFNIGKNRESFAKGC